MLARGNWRRVAKFAIRFSNTRALCTSHRLCQSLSFAEDTHTHVAQEWREMRAWSKGKEENEFAMEQQFGSFAVDYDKHRPNYPAAMFDRLIQLAIGKSKKLQDTQLVRALDVGTGTGKVAIPLLSHGLHVTATDSDQLMLDILMKSQEASNPEFRRNLECVQCRGESLDVPDNSQDLVTVFQAFHWMNAKEALAEFDRVLKPNGILAIGWNDRDITEPWVADMEAMFERFNPTYSRDMKQSDLWASVIANKKLAQVHRKVPEKYFHHVRYQSVEDVLQLCHTFSYVKNSLSPAKLSSFDEEMRARLKAEFRGKQEIILPYISKVYIYRKI